MQRRLIEPGDYRGTEPCALANAVHLVAEKWVLFLVHAAFAGSTRFSDFRAGLGIAADVLAARLDRLVDAGVMRRVPYLEPGHRQRERYELTDAGEQLALIVLALQDWGEQHVPSSRATAVSFADAAGNDLHAGFVNADGDVVAAEDVRWS